MVTDIVLFVSTLLVGIIIGGTILAPMYIKLPKAVGVLQVHKDEDDSYLFLELAEPVESVAKEKMVVLFINSQK